MSCAQTFHDYALRSIGLGERLLPRTDFTLCDQFVLIGSGMLWNLYFGIAALAMGFFLATAVALGRSSQSWPVRKASEWFIFLFRGSPLFIQFFLAYQAFVLLPRVGVDIPLGVATISVQTSWLTKAWLGAVNQRRSF